MARRQFGDGVADWTFAAIDAVDGHDDMVGLAGGIQVTFWTAQTGGTQVTDLLAADGVTPITYVVSSLGGDGRDVGTIPGFYGPDDGTDRLWAQGGDGTRKFMSAIGDSSAEDLTTVLVARGLYTDQGVLLAGLGPDNPGSLAAGIDGQVLTVDSTAPMGMTWVTPGGTLGNVLWWTGSDYAPIGLKTATDLPRIFIGPVDPASVAGVVLSPFDWHDTWIGG